MADIFCSGGCGYVGSVLVPKLLRAGHFVRVVDNQWFGNYLPKHRSLQVIKRDIRDKTISLAGVDAVIHLAAVANDPAAQLNPVLSWQINALGTNDLAERAAREGVKQFIYASSGSVYGVSDEPEVTEDTSLVPLSEYNMTKMVAERAVLSYAPRMGVVIFRPATVCGFSPRMRLDLMVNSFVIQALQGGVIKFNGGEQYRPNIHIDDMTDLYVWALLRDGLSGIFNAGFENMKIKDIAKLVAEKTQAQVIAQESNDPRSYRLNSDKLLAAGFKPSKTVANAITELVNRCGDGSLRDVPEWYNLSFMSR